VDGGVGEGYEDGFFGEVDAEFSFEGAD